MRGLILFGAPGSGKHTISQFLETSGLGYTVYPKLKLGLGRTHGYRMVTAEQMGKVHQGRLIVQQNDRYGNWYVVEKYLLYHMLGKGHVPIFQMGSIEGISQIVRFAPGMWLKVWLRCSPMETRIRLQNRGSADVEDRMTVWESLETQARRCPPGFFDLQLRTDEMDPSEAAIRIDEAWSFLLNRDDIPSPF